MLVDVTQSMNGVVLLKAQLFQIKPESRSKEPNLEFRGLEVFYLHGNEIGPLDKDDAIFFWAKIQGQWDFFTNEKLTPTDVLDGLK